MARKTNPLRAPRQAKPVEKKQAGRLMHERPVYLNVVYKTGTQG
jgi:hypothetical protein